MPTYNQAAETTAKVLIRDTVAGGQDVVAAPLTTTQIASVGNSTIQSETYPEWASGYGFPNWTDNVVLHSSTNVVQGTRVVSMQVFTNPEGIGSNVLPANWPPYGSQKQTSQVPTRQLFS